MPATHKSQMGMTVYAPELAGDDGRPLAVVHGMERAFPGLHLGWRISDEGQHILLPDRAAWVSRGKPGGFPLLSNGKDEDFVSVAGIKAAGNIASGGQAQLEVHVVLPLAAVTLEVATEVLQEVAEGARAYWGHATPFSAGVDIARQTKNWAANPQPPPRGLPALKLPRNIRSPEIPHRLGWLNYWSAAAAQAIGFPDAARDADLLASARRTASGGWMVRLTEAPLELDKPEHLEALLRAYERFPEIGGRV